MRFVQSYQRRKCANSCSRMTLRSFGGTSRNAHAGKTIVRFQKPMAAGTRTLSDVAIVIEPNPTDLDALIASKGFCTAGSRFTAAIGVQLLRSPRRRQNPVAKRTI